LGRGNLSSCLWEGKEEMFRGWEEGGKWRCGMAFLLLIIGKKSSHKRRRRETALVRPPPLPIKKGEEAREEIEIFSLFLMGGGKRRREITGDAFLKTGGENEGGGPSQLSFHELEGVRKTKRPFCFLGKEDFQSMA